MAIAPKKIANFIEPYLTRKRAIVRAIVPSDTPLKEAVTFSAISERAHLGYLRIRLRDVLLPLADLEVALESDDGAIAANGPVTSRPIADEIGI